MSEHECRAHYQPTDQRAPIVHDAPAETSAEDWHVAAIGDTHTSHSLVGHRYVVACEWCRCVFIAATKIQAMALFRDHESDMQTSRGGEPHEH